MSKLNLTGIWWDASAPGDRVAGTLTFDVVKGGQLTLVGAIGGVKAVTDQADIGLIHGLAGNKLVTLCGAHTTSMSMNIPGPHSHTIATNRVLVGAHVSEADLEFDEVEVEFEYLPEFIEFWPDHDRAIGI